MLRVIILATILLAPGVSLADYRITSKKDALGYTHTTIDRDDRKTTRCVSKRDALGYTHTDCHTD